MRQGSSNYRLTDIVLRKEELVRYIVWRNPETLNTYEKYFKRVFGYDGIAIQTCMHEPTMKDKSSIYVAGLSFEYASVFHHSDSLADQWQRDGNQTLS